MAVPVNPPNVVSVLGVRERVSGDYPYKNDAQKKSWQYKNQ